MVSVGMALALCARSTCSLGGLGAYSPRKVFDFSESICDTFSSVKVRYLDVGNDVHSGHGTDTSPDTCLFCKKEV